MSTPIARNTTGQSPFVPAADRPAPKIATNQPADNTEKSGNGNSQVDHGKLTEYHLEGQMRSVALSTQAEKQLSAVPKNQLVDIHNPESRNQLIRSAPQINEISKKAGNGGDICGGAATTNALILSSKTPEQGRANAKAVRDLANSFSNAVKIKPEEEMALKHLENGKMSPTDVQHMQQLMDRIGQRMPAAGPNPSGLGLTTTQVACMMTKLSAKGAFQGSDVTMHCNTLPNGLDHWTVTVDRTFANSSHGHPNYDKALVHGGPPPELQKGRSNWQNEIKIVNDPQRDANDKSTGPKIYAQFKQGEDKNQYREAVFHANEHVNPNSVAQFENEMRRAAEASAIPIQ
jgi:hypothetical protein